MRLMLLWRGVSTRLVLAVVVVAVMGVWTAAFAQGPVAQMSAIPIHEGTVPIVLDGDLDDPAWSAGDPHHRIRSTRAARGRARDDAYGGARGI